MKDKRKFSGVCIHPQCNCAAYYSVCAATGEPLEEKSSEARKDDDGKPRFELLPADALLGVTEIFTLGAKKYGDNNWAYGLKWSRLFGALMRHLWAWWRRENLDPETHLPHLFHAGACILMLISHEARKIGEDDRP